jgi:amidase
VTGEPVSGAAYILKIPYLPGRVRLAVKDLIDVRGFPTTAGCRAVAETAEPAAADAPCLAGARAARAAIVGKTNLHELAFGGSGINAWFGTPVNPLDPGLVPGGSSSGSAVAVARGEADVGYGSDTAGSVRIPSAFCGTTGLKTTQGRVPLAGVWPLAPSLDTVGPMAVDVAGVAAGMRLLEPGFAVAEAPASRAGRLRLPDVAVDPRIDAAVDAALARSGLEVTDLGVSGWRDALRAGSAIIFAEAAAANRHLAADPAARAMLSGQVRDWLDQGAALPGERVAAARQFQGRWRPVLARLLDSTEVLVLPTVPLFPPPLAEAERHESHYVECTLPVNLAGLPALALPVPSDHRLPASLQLIGPPGSEGLLLATGALIEEAAGYRHGRAAGPG